jgi:hypothetical protein
MENNIFIKMQRNKYNPDIENKLKGKEIERENTEFDLLKSIYNPITGIIPKEVKTNQDLILEKDLTYSSSDIKKLILEKENERIIQDSQYKPIKTKVINNTPENDNNIKNNYIETFEDLKKSLNSNKKDLAITNNTQKKNYDNILDGLKDLGIIK